MLTLSLLSPVVEAIAVTVAGLFVGTLVDGADVGVQGKSVGCLLGVDVDGADVGSLVGVDVDGADVGSLVGVVVGSLVGVDVDGADVGSLVSVCVSLSLSLSLF